MYVNQNDQFGESAFIGKTAENVFEEILKSQFIDYRPATLEEQYKHIDFVINSEKLGKEIKVDVKATKKRSRSDNKTNSSYVWIEFVNVQGKKGWLYGESDYIAFYDDGKTCFYLINREDLVKFCEKNVDDKIVTTAQEALHHKYTRENRKDVLSLFYLEEILTCKNHVIKR